MTLKAEAIKEFSDYQLAWDGVIPPLRKNRYDVDKARSMHGDAPKDFVRIQEYIPNRANRRRRNWTAYIAKVGIKRYPVESITEHLLTRFGQIYGVEIASSRLLMMAGQVRFLSKYFLKSKSESLVHGLEIFRRHLDDAMVDEIADQRREREFYTFQTVCHAIQQIYPNHFDFIMPKMVELLAFDALVGNNDRHPLNWGVIVPIAANKAVRFSPIFDTARGMFWNVNDSQLVKFVSNDESMTAYVRRSKPQISWDTSHGVNHFQLISLIYREYPQYRGSLEKFANPDLPEICARVCMKEFNLLMSQIRRQAICKCALSRHEHFCSALTVGGNHNDNT